MELRSMAKVALRNIAIFWWDYIIMAIQYMPNCRFVAIYNVFVTSITHSA